MCVGGQILIAQLGQHPVKLSYQIGVLISAEFRWRQDRIGLRSSQLMRSKTSTPGLAQPITITYRPACLMRTRLVRDQGGDNISAKRLQEMCDSALFGQFSVPERMKSITCKPDLARASDEILHRLA